MTQQEQIQKFEQETGYTLEVKDGKTYYGGWLNLRGTGITALPEGLTVGGWLDLSGTGITSLPDNLTVGGYLDLNGCTGITDTSHVRRQLTAEQRKKISLAQNPLLQWEFGGRKYIKIDGIFSQVLRQRGNVYRTCQLDGQEGYLITDGEGNYAHGDTLEEARTDLLYKISDRDKSAYEHLTLDSSLPFDDAVVCYRVITGACSPGTRDYIANRLPQPRKEAYTIGEMIELTRGEYGGKTFEEFFNK